MLDPTATEQLILGPFQGKVRDTTMPARSQSTRNQKGSCHAQVACQTIRFGRGVCGAAAATKQTQLVPDVEAFPGHIACDGASKSEIVVPIVSNDKVYYRNFPRCIGTWGCEEC